MPMTSLTCLKYKASKQEKMTQNNTLGLLVPKDFNLNSSKSECIRLEVGLVWLINWNYHWTWPWNVFGFHCAQSVRFWSFSSSIFAHIQTELEIYTVNICIQCKMGKHEPEENPYWSHFLHCSLLNIVTGIINNQNPRELFFQVSDHWSKTLYENVP